MINFLLATDSEGVNQNPSASDATSNQSCIQDGDMIVPLEDRSDITLHKEQGGVSLVLSASKPIHALLDQTEVLKKITSLSLSDISDEHIHEVADFISKLTNLAIIKITGSPNLKPDSFGVILEKIPTNLQKLTIVNQNIYTASLRRAVLRLRNLEQLTLGNNHITDWHNLF